MKKPILRKRKARPPKQAQAGKPRSAAQIERQMKEHRERGRYAKVNPCEVCAKSAGVNYFSDFRCNEWGKALVLCEKCAPLAEDCKTLYEFEKLVIQKTKKNI